MQDVIVFLQGVEALIKAEEVAVGVRSPVALPTMAVGKVTLATARPARMQRLSHSPRARSPRATSP